jgi:hypothetical protein
MDLISDLETDLALAFLVEKRHRQQIDSEGAVALIRRVKTLLETISAASRRPSERVDHPDPDASLARAILADLRAGRPEALVDLHNTSGFGPWYGVGTRANADQLALVSLFSGYHVLTDIRLGTLMEATEDDWPTVTIECGGAQDPRSDKTAYTGLTRYLGAPTLFGAPETGSAVSVLRHPIRVRLADGAAVAYGSEPATDAPLTLRRDIDRFNSSVLTEDDPIGWASSQVASLSAFSA